MNSLIVPLLESSSVPFFLIGLYVFVLSCFAGYQLITKVPPTLHTPLMSGANAISGITLLGAMSVTALVDGQSTELATVIGFFAVVLATLNVVGGFAVTHRMLKMFRKKPSSKQEGGQS